ncbi:hypothetical protein U8527_10470 [Kordia algicida OT-1]|uniref:Uncharacterized protein n=1 Tax=Kordia algicida OT-1 TaxID=391587 RepID=A9DW99_9FLAO|nr:hypothetical protein [Kordia algicida]EDP96530.1 hypothetical protein KAOT1_03937 [Kordia algicida OT-1]
MNKQQILYNRAIDNLTYLVLNYSKPVQELLAYHHVFFKGNPSKEQLINEVVEQIKLGNKQFISSLEKLMIRFSKQENDQFWGAIAKGALGIVGGLLGKKKRRSSSGASSANAAAQANAAKRDMERRLREMQAQQERERREAERRAREAEARRVREAKEARERAEAEKKKMNMIMGIGAGVVVIGVILVIALKPKTQAPPYRQYPPMPQVSSVQMPQ